MVQDPPSHAINIGQQGILMIKSDATAEERGLPTGIHEEFSGFVPNRSDPSRTPFSPGGSAKPSVRSGTIHDTLPGTSQYPRMGLFTSSFMIGK